MKRLALSLGPPLLVVILSLTLWEGAKRLGGLPVFIPGPAQIWAELAGNPKLFFGNLWPTVNTAATGYAVAAIITFIAAIISALLQPLRVPIYGLSVTINAVPIIAKAPLLAMWLGTGPSMHVIIVALTCQFPLLVGTLQGLGAADPRQREMMHSLSASRWQMFWHLRLPASLPYLFAGFRIAAPLAVLGAVTAEWAGANTGLGAMMLYALFSYDIAKVWLSVLACCLLSALAYALWAVVERRIVTWDDGLDR